MKRFILLFVTVMALFIAIPKEAYASSYQPNYTELEGVSGINGFDMITSKWGQEGITLNRYPYRAFLSYKGAKRTMYVGFTSASPIVFNANTLQFTSDSEFITATYDFDSGFANYTSAFVLLDTREEVKFYANHNVMMWDGSKSFFPLPPVPTPKPTLGEIVETGTSQQSPMSQVISLLPLLIFLVASLLGLRKCLQMLRNLLTKA